MRHARERLIAHIQGIAARGWCQATAGNFSCRLSQPGENLRLLMTPSGVNKALIGERDLIEVGKNGDILAGTGVVSAEHPLHVAVYERYPSIEAVLHGHSVWNTVLSRRFLKDGAIQLEGFEILKAFKGITTHETRMAVPILQNSQNMAELTRQLTQRLEALTGAVGFLLAGHGLYAWGDSLPEAYRHFEAFEFLFEVLGREMMLPNLN